MARAWSERELPQAPAVKRQKWIKRPDRSTNIVHLINAAHTIPVAFDISGFMATLFFAMEFGAV